MCLLYRGRGCLILLSLMTNLALICLTLNFCSIDSFFEWQWPILIVLFCVVTQLLVGGFHRQTVGAILSTLSTTLLIFLLYQLTVDRGEVIPYEMMEDVFGSAPLETIYRFSVIAGSIGAIMDVSVTIHSAVDKLTDSGEDLNVKATLASLRNIGADIMDLPVCLAMALVAVIPPLFRGRFYRAQGILMLLLYLGYIVILVL